MKARGIVFEKRYGSCGERLPHPIRVRLIDGPNADPEGPGLCLVGDAPIGATVTVEYSADDHFARIVHASLEQWTAEDIEGSCPSCEAFAIVELTARLKARQPDGTTHVCLPSFGGCNLGFSCDPRD